MKLSPLMKSTAIVRDLFPQRANDQLASILYKERTDGLARLLITGANSPAGLSQVTITAQTQDDLSKYEVNAMGDPELMADSRSRAIADAKIFKISTPLVAPGCRITRNFVEGSQEYPYVGCPHCGEHQILEWDNMLATLDPANPDDAHFTCVGCGSLIEESDRPRLLATFQWRAHNSSAAKTHRSFWIWSAYSYLQTWPQIAREWLRARGDPASEKTFTNDVLGKPYEAKGEGRPPEELAARAAKSDYQRGSVPRGALILTLGIDCQLDRVEWVLLGHGENYKRFVIDCGTVGKHISELDCQRNLDLLLQRRWPNICGREIGISLAAVDAGYSTEDVIDYCRRHSPSRLIAVRGVPGDAVPRIAKVQRERDEKRGTVLKYGRQFFNIGIYQFKGSMYRDLDKNDAAEKGFIAFPCGLPDSFFEELVCERRVPYRRMGVIAYKWEKPDKAANEMHDCFLYASAAAIKYGVNWISDQGWAKLRAELETPTSARHRGSAILSQVSSPVKRRPAARIGLAWYERARLSRDPRNDGGRALSARDLRKLAGEGPEERARSQGQGHDVVRDMISPGKFPAWCQSRGLRLNANARKGSMRTHASCSRRAIAMKCVDQPAAYLVPPGIAAGERPARRSIRAGDAGCGR